MSPRALLHLGSLCTSCHGFRAPKAAPGTAWALPGLFGDTVGHSCGTRGPQGALAASPGDLSLATLLGLGQRWETLPAPGRAMSNPGGGKKDAAEYLSKKGWE